MPDQESAGKTNAGKENEIIVSVDANIADLIPAFLERKLKVVSQWYDIMGRGDYEALADLGHDLSGTGGAFGFREISEIGDSLQAAVGKNDHQEARRLAEEYSDYLRRIKVVYA